MRKTQKKNLKLKRIGRASEVPASQGQLEAVRSELKSDIMSVGLKMDSLDARMTSVRDELKADIARLESSVQRVIALVEEQTARNNWVIDAYKIVVDVQEDLRTRTGRLETKVFG